MKRAYRSAIGAKKSRKMLTKEEFRKLKEKEMQRNLQLQKEAKDNSGKNPEDTLFFKMADSMMLL